MPRGVLIKGLLILAASLMPVLSFAHEIDEINEMRKELTRLAARVKALEAENQCLKGNRLEAARQVIASADLSRVSFDGDFRYRCEVFAFIPSSLVEPRETQ